MHLVVDVAHMCYVCRGAVQDGASQHNDIKVIKIVFRLCVCVCGSDEIVHGAPRRWCITLRGRDIYIHETVSHRLWKRLQCNYSTKMILFFNTQTRTRTVPPRYVYRCELLISEWWWRFVHLTHIYSAQKHLYSVLCVWRVYIRMFCQINCIPLSI